MAQTGFHLTYEELKHRFYFNVSIGPLASFHLTYEELKLGGKSFGINIPEIRFHLTYEELKPGLKKKAQLQDVYVFILPMRN